MRAFGGNALKGMMMCLPGQLMQLENKYKQWLSRTNSMFFSFTLWFTYSFIYVDQVASLDRQHATHISSTAPGNKNIIKEHRWDRVTWWMCLMCRSTLHVRSVSIKTVLHFTTPNIIIYLHYLSIKDKTTQTNDLIPKPAFHMST